MKYFTQKKMFSCDDPYSLQNDMIKLMKGVLGEFKYSSDFTEPDVYGDSDAIFFIHIESDNPHGVDSLSDLQKKVHEVYEVLDPIFKNEGLKVGVYLQTSRSTIKPDTLMFGVKIVYGL